MSTPTITLNGTFTDAAGDPQSGTLSFRLNHDLVDSVGNVVSARESIVSTLDAQGRITDTNGSTVGLVLYCTSGGDIAPAGLLYDVQVQVGDRPKKRSIAIPSTLGASVDWADLVPVPSSTGVVWTVPDLTAEQARDLVGTTLVAGDNITITVDDDANTVTITGAESGLTQEQIEDLTAALIDDNSDLDWTYDDASASLVAVIKPGAVTAAKVAADVATQAELDALSGTFQPLDPDLTTVAAIDSTTAGALVTDGAGWIRKTYAQLKTALSLVKGDVGLGNVDNTSDANKPVSTATQTALDLKANAANPVFTGTVTIPDGALAIADTSGLQAALDAKVPADLSTLTASTSPDTDDELVVWLDGALRRVPVSNVLALASTGGASFATQIVFGG